MKCLSLVPVIPFEMATSGPWHIEETKILLDVLGTDNVQHRFFRVVQGGISPTLKKVLPPPENFVAPLSLSFSEFSLENF